MRFPITDLLDETEYLKWLEHHLHPSWLACFKSGSTRGMMTATASGRSIPPQEDPWTGPRTMPIT